MDNQDGVPEEQPVAALAMRLFQYAQRAARVTLFVVVPVTIGSYFYLSYLGPPAGSAPPWAVALASFVAAILTNVIPVLAVVAFIKPIADVIAGARDREADTARIRGLAKAITDLLRPDAARTEASLRRIEHRLNINIPIFQVYSSFEELKWDTVLTNAESLDLAASYWSSDWLDRNLPHFNRAIDGGTAISLFVSNPYEQDNEFYAHPTVSAKTNSRILDTIGRYIRIGRAHPARRRVYVSKASINYMLPGSDTPIARLSRFHITATAK